MNTFMTKIIEAEKPFYEGEMTSLIVPAVDGDYGILAMHQNLVIAIIPGLLRFQNPDGEWQEVSVSDGMVRIEDGEVLVLVDSAEWPYEIDIERVKRKEAAARELREEVGIEVKELQLFGLYSGDDRMITYPNQDVVYSLAVIF